MAFPPSLDENTKSNLSDDVNVKVLPSLHLVAPSLLDKLTEAETVDAQRTPRVLALPLAPFCDLTMSLKGWRLSRAALTDPFPQHTVNP